MHFQNGRWHPYSYLWDEAGAEAWLVESIGKNRPLRIPAASGGTIERTWHVNAINECKLCHNAESGFVLGFVPNQLDRMSSQDSSLSQPTRLAAERVLSGAMDKVPELLSLVDPHDSTQTVESRARSYLHVNCSMCHQPGGNAIVSFYLRRDMPFDKLNTNKGTGIGRFGMHDPKIILPGDPYRSVLMYRMSKLGYARMPYIGSQLVDSAGVALVDEWIASLDAEPGKPKSAPVTDTSDEFDAIKLLLAKETSPLARREDAVRLLIQTTEGALALIAQIHRDSLSTENRQLAVEMGSSATSSDIRGLFETFLPESKRRATLGANTRVDIVLGLPGDANRGKLIYHSDTARCRACHDVADRNHSLGPTLHEINKKYQRPEEFVQHILQPSLKIEEPVSAYTLVTKDGRALQGMLVEQSDREVVLKTTEKKLFRIPRSDIDDLRKSDKSLMPDFLLSDLTAQEAADLVHYIRSLGTGD